jgi:hypothetical protein
LSECVSVVHFGHFAWLPAALSGTCIVVEQRAHLICIAHVGVEVGAGGISRSRIPRRYWDYTAAGLRGGVVKFPAHSGHLTILPARVLGTLTCLRQCGQRTRTPASRCGAGPPWPCKNRRPSSLISQTPCGLSLFTNPSRTILSRAHCATLRQRGMSGCVSSGSRSTSFSTSFISSRTRSRTRPISALPPASSSAWRIGRRYTGALSHL